MFLKSSSYLLPRLCKQESSKIGLNSNNVCSGDCSAVSKNRIRLVDLHSFDEFFFGDKKFSWMPSKNKVTDEDLHFQRHKNILVKLKCLVLALLFISYFLLGSQLIFSSPKKDSSNESTSVFLPKMGNLLSV